MNLLDNIVINRYQNDFLDLRLGDCIDYLTKFKENEVDLAIVDPPYGYGEAKTDILNFRQTDTHRNWNTAPSPEYFDQLRVVAENQIVWGGNYFGNLWESGCRGFIYWHKGNPVSNFADGELAWTSFDVNARQIDYRCYGGLEGNSSSSKKHHPTQKPVKLYEWLLLNYAKEGQTILDTHLGSGSIAIAVNNVNKAEGMNLHLTGFEKDPDYFEAMCKRLDTAFSQTTIFD